MLTKSSRSSLLSTITKHFRSLSTASVTYCCVYFVIFGYFVISVDAIRCHQCNSYDDSACLGLMNDDGNIFLKECDHNNKTEPFCRKIALTVEYKKERRIIRSCGYTPHLNRSERCFTADNEGYLEQVCQCFKDGCNTATTTLKFNHNQNIIILLGLIFIYGLITNRIRCI